MMYRAPYSTVHRADLQRILLEHAQQHGIVPQLQKRVIQCSQQGDSVEVVVENGAVQPGNATNTTTITTQVLVGADGLWSRVRQQMLPNAPEPQYAGMVAYRALVEQDELPMPLRSQHVTLWIAPQWHIAHYPVCGGKYLNVVVIVTGAHPPDLHNWDHSANATDLRVILSNACAPVRNLAESIADWRLWPVCDRPHLSGAHEMAQGRITLLGDAAHHMLPFLAQGAGMSLEDAWVLSHCASQYGSTPAALAQYAHMRWQRCSTVQQRSVRNGQLFHSEGLLRVARNFAIMSLGQNLLDVPWLFGQGPV